MGLSLGSIACKLIGWYFWWKLGLLEVCDFCKACEWFLELCNQISCFCYFMWVFGWGVIEEFVSFLHVMCYNFQEFGLVLLLLGVREEERMGSSKASDFLNWNEMNSLHELMWSGFMTHPSKVRCWVVRVSGTMTHMRVRGRSRGREENGRENSTIVLINSTIVRLVF
jgi:hypothetical protein